MQTKFEIQGEYIELSKLLKAAGLCSTGGTAKIAISEGLVAVDGQVERRRQCKIRKGQVVTLAGHTIKVA
ncbi:MAG: RNA-binding S4 domain-containing protein [Desulfatitalea sp.]